MTQPNPLYQYVPVNTTYVPAQEVQRHRVQTSYDPRRVPTFVEDSVEFGSRGSRGGCPVHGSKRYNEVSQGRPVYPSNASAVVSGSAPPVYSGVAPSTAPATPAYPPTTTTTTYTGGAYPVSTTSYPAGGAAAYPPTGAAAAPAYPAVAGPTGYPASHSEYSQGHSQAPPQFQAVPVMTGADVVPRGDSSAGRLASTSYLLTYPRGDEADAVQYRGMVNAASASTSEGYTTLSALPARRAGAQRACC